MTAPVRTDALTKRYGGSAAVDELNLTIEPGEVYGFLGPNAAGKTTTLRMLLGLVTPTSGTARLHGRHLGSRGYLDDVGALVEGPAFYPFLSGRENLRVLARHAGMAAARVAAVLDEVELTERASDKYATYSLGMKQRLGIAAALLKEPTLLILDEPTNGLDPAGMADMRALLRRLGEQGRTVLLSSHLLSEVQQICDRVGVLSRGVLVAERPVGELGAGGRLVLVAEPADAAQARLVAAYGSDRVRRHDDVIELDVDSVAAAAINTDLVGAGIAVSELRWRRPNLEEVFFSLTGESRVAA
ncbi:MAG: ATP-binding cassette domain-containing protein [Actinophytocola sp.]|nr:ATP-binding cassette domain-containing protein [Actinophytocola sp.]